MAGPADSNVSAAELRHCGERPRPPRPGSIVDVYPEEAMSTAEVPNDPIRRPSVELKLEAVVIPVADVDRSKEFYAGLGWRLDADFAFDNGFRVVQFTPPGSGCSVQFGTNMTSAAPGSAQRPVPDRRPTSTPPATSSRPGRRRQRGVPPRGPGRAVPARRRERSGQRPGTRSRQLQLVRHVQRSGRQRLAAAGDHHPAARADRRRADVVRVGGRHRERAAASGGGPRRARGAHRARPMRTGRSGTPRTWWRSRPGPSSRRDGTVRRAGCCR